MNRITEFKYTTIVSSEDKFVSHHQISDIKVLPGTALIELVIDALYEEGIDINTIKLEDCTFYEPVIVSEEYCRKIAIICRIFENNKAIINIKSCRVINEQEIDEYTDNFSACVCECVEGNLITIDAEAIKKKAIRISDMEDFYGNTRKMNIFHYEYMKGYGKIYENEDTLLAEIKLCSSADSDSYNYFIQPVYLDAATIVALSLFHKQLFQDRPVPCIPIHVDSFQAYKMLRGKCYVYVKKSDIRIVKTNDIYYTNIGIYDENGEIVAQINNLAAKKVRKIQILKNIEAGVKLKELEETSSILNKQEKNVERKGSIEEYIVSLICRKKGILPENVYLSAGFYELGLDSGDLMDMVGELENYIGVILYPTLLFEYSNVRELARYLQENYKEECSRVIENDLQVAEVYNEKNVSNYNEEFSFLGRKIVQSDLGRVQCDFSNVLYVGTDNDKLRKLERLFRNKGLKISKICFEKSFNIVSGNEINILETKEQDYVEAAKKLVSNKKECIVILSDEAKEKNISILVKILYLLKALMRVKGMKKIRIIYFYAGTMEEIVGKRAIESVLKSLVLENNKFSYKLIENVHTVEKLVDEICCEEDINCVVRYINNIRYVQKIALLEVDKRSGANISMKSEGVYLITGGAGKIGAILANYIASAVKCNIILIGRSEANNNINKVISDIEHRGSNALYLQKDISVYSEVKDLVDIVKEKYGKIDGIIHCAGVINDAVIMNKNVSYVRDVIGAKVDGIKNLDECTKNEMLEFFVACSSSASITGNVGQAEYAYANAFLDFFMEFRNELVKTNERFGKSVAINWTYWQNGGMQINEQTENNLREKLGVYPLTNEDGVNAFVDSLTKFEGHVMPIKGNSKKIISFLGGIKENEGDIVDESKIPSMQVEDIGEHDIAIIGLEGKYPQANDLKEFWENLCQGKDCITEIPDSRFDYQKYYSPNKDDKGNIYCKCGGFLDDIEKFCPTFFNISPREAEIMDPQERLFLLMTWHLFEDAGYNCEELSGKDIGVYVGVMWGQYQLLKHENNGKPYALSSIYSSIANRVSYTFNLLGPSMAVDTMCSSSLTSIHLACQAINNGDCEMAVAGGVNLNLHPNKYLFLSQQKFVSEVGKCQAFDENADGYVPGEGVGAVLLKPLSKAISDRDNIYGVIKGSVITHGGKSGGYTVPNPKSETSTILKALAKAKVNAREISYIEAHGTGTSLGDPIEISALSKAFEEHTKDIGFCSIGSVKSNIGHCEAAAGIAAITKVLLQFKHKMLVPTININTVNKKIEFDNSAFVLQRSLEAWDVGKGDRMAGISAFGAGGSNSHMILKEFKIRHEVKNKKRDKYIILISAKSKVELSNYIEKYRDYVDDKCSWLEKMSVFSVGVEKWVKDQIASVMGISGDNISLRASLAEYGLDKYSLQVLNNIINEATLQECEDFSISISEDTVVSELIEIVERNLYGKEVKAVDYEAYEQELLEQIAYVTQNGRKHFKERIAICAESLRALYSKLNMCLEEIFDGAQNGIYRGTVNVDSNNINENDSDLKKLEQDILKYDSDSLAKSFVIGKDINWTMLYDEQPWKISLPSYPFMTKRYWVSSCENEYKELTKESTANQTEAKETEDNEFDALLLERANSYNGDEVKLEIIDEQIAIVTMMDKENKNMYTENIVHGLINKFNQINNMDNIKVVIVTGYDQVFCMGGTEQQLNDISNLKHKFSDVKFLHRGLLETKVPVIAAMQGHAYGGGFLFGLYADIVVLAEESVYAAIFTKYGFTPGMGSTMILEEKLGRDLALEMMYTARPFSGKELKERNAQVCVRKRDDVMDHALSVAKMIADKPRLTLEVLKKEMAGRILEKFPYILERENEMHRKTFTTDETKKRLAESFRVPEEKSKDRSDVKIQSQSVDDNTNKSSDIDRENLELLELVKKGELTASQAKKLLKF